VEAVDVHPEQRHERKKMSDVEGGGGRVDTNVGADTLVY
jgi:hypothetical protein